MKPQIIHKNPIILLGMSFYGDPFSTKDPWREENEIGRLWQRFMKFQFSQADRIQNKINPQTGYEVCITNEDTMQIGHFEIFAGVEVSEIVSPPVELSAKILPASQYAVFTIQGEKIASDWNYELSQKWLPESGCKQSGNYNFQLYDERFKGMNRLKDSAIDVYIPIE